MHMQYAGIVQRKGVMLKWVSVVALYKYQVSVHLQKKTAKIATYDVL